MYGGLIATSRTEKYNIIPTVFYEDISQILMKFNFFLQLIDGLNHGLLQQKFKGPLEGLADESFYWHTGATVLDILKDFNKDPYNSVKLFEYAFFERIKNEQIAQMLRT